MRRENSCLHESNVSRGAYAAPAYCALHAHSHFVCLICILLSAHLLPSSHYTLYAYTRAYTRVRRLYRCCCSAKLKETFVFGRCTVRTGTHIGTCIRIIIMEECSFYSDVFRLGSCFFIFTIVLFGGFFFSSAPRKVVCIINYNTVDGRRPGPN